MNSIFTKSASIYIGAFLFLAGTSCKKEKSTPDWHNQDRSHEKSTLTTPLASSTTSPDTSYKKTKTPAPGSTASLRFLSYNLKNYLTQPYIEKEKVKQPVKKQAEITHLVEIIAAAKPDILGLCEINTKADVLDLQQRLKTSGIHLPYHHLTHGVDPVRSLAFLSRHPLINKQQYSIEGYSIEGRSFKISRGILDITVQLPLDGPDSTTEVQHTSIRFIGSHLKSKRPSPYADQALMRRHESILVRQYIDTILQNSPDTKLIVYGDLNDSRRSQAVSTIRGKHNTPTGLKILELADSRGDKWTYHWNQEDIYSRFDYLMYSKNLSSSVNKADSKILDPHNWRAASDHRPLLLLLNLEY